MENLRFITSSIRFKHLRVTKNPVVLVILPLNAPIEDQIVSKLGIVACKLDALQQDIASLVTN